MAHCHYACFQQLEHQHARRLAVVVFVRFTRGTSFKQRKPAPSPIYSWVSFGPEYAAPSVSVQALSMRYSGTFPCRYHQVIAPCMTVWISSSTGRNYRTSVSIVRKRTS
uniref:Uncharacterized protein n=1 Tax=Cacopsylla melanoneura TaxID=428564 RepID=A0A8D8PYV8_9HEMI